MIDLSTTYLGISLENPIIASSSPLCAKLDAIKRMEDSGAAGVVLHSLFEEQVVVEQQELNTYLLQGTEQFAESLTYLPDYGTYKFAASEYIEHIRKCKESIDIPVIGSLNGITRGGWIKYGREIEQAGADGLELNMFYLPTDPRMTSVEVEENYIGLVSDVVKSVNIPVAVKTNPYLSAVPNMVERFKNAGASAVVLFNRFYQPDIDLNTLEIIPNLKLSTSTELRLRLRWIGLLFGKIHIDMAVTGGVHTSEDALKCMAAGAKVAMTTSALLKKGIPYIEKIKSGMSEWLEQNGYRSIKSFQGIMSRLSTDRPEAYIRSNYLQMLGSYTVMPERGLEGGLE